MPTLRELAWSATGTRAVAPQQRVMTVTAPAAEQLETRATPRTAPPDAEQQIGTALFRQPQRRGVLAEQARAFADENEWCRAAINRLKDRVARAERSVMPADPDRGYNKKLAQQIEYLIENPNPRGDSWRSFIEPVIEDVLTLGKGGWEYVPNWRGWPLALYPYNAQYMSIDETWDGSRPRAPRYYWSPVPRQVTPLRNDEATCIIYNPSTHRADGLSPIDTLKLTLEAEAASSEFVRTMLKKYPPPGWLHLGESAGSRQVQRVSDKLQTDILGKGGMLITAGLKDPKFTNLWGGTSRDNELQAWSHYFAYKVCAVFHISPQDVGLTFDINKSTAESQQDLSAEGGYKALLMLVEEYVNREIVSKFGTPETINIRFAFKELTAKDRMEQAEWVMKLTGGVPVLMMNEARKELDLDPLDEHGDAIYTTGTMSAFAGPDAQEIKDDAQQRAMDLAAATKPPGGAGPRDSGGGAAAGTGGTPAAPASGTEGGAQSAEQDKNAGSKEGTGKAGSSKGKPKKGKKRGMTAVDPGPASPALWSFVTALARVQDQTPSLDMPLHAADVQGAIRFVYAELTRGYAADAQRSIDRAHDAAAARRARAYAYSLYMVVQRHLDAIPRTAMSARALDYAIGLALDAAADAL